jgi:hypothetical protein
MTEVSGTTPPPVGEDEAELPSMGCLTISLSYEMILHLIVISSFGSSLIVSTFIWPLRQKSRHLLMFVGTFLMSPILILFYKLYATVLPPLYRTSVDLQEDEVADIGA